MQNKGGPCLCLDNTAVVDNYAAVVMWTGRGCLVQPVNNCYVLCLCYTTASNRLSLRRLSCLTQC